MLPKRIYSKRGEKSECRGHPLYLTWYGMLKRCYAETVKGYENYGGRGIFVSEDWWHFENFLRDMGEKPTRHHTLDRIDNELGYSKFNCRWATRSEQCVNRRTFKNNTSGETGVTGVAYGYTARYDYNGARYQIGRFTSYDDAVSARRAFVKMFHSDKERALQSISSETIWNNSKVKVRGITQHSDGGYVARATVNGKREYIGYFKTIDEAKNARLNYIAART